MAARGTAKRAVVMTRPYRARRPARRTRGDGRQPPGGRYGLLLLMLVVSYLASAFRLTQLAEPLQVGLFAVVLGLALRTSPLNRRQMWLIGTVMITGSAAAALAALSHAQAGDGVADLWRGLMLLVAAVIIVRRVLAQPTVTVQSIYGALSAYLMIGLMFAACYAAVGHLGGTPFFVNGETASPQTFQYFSFTTLTTLGYGDFTAASDGGRAVAVIEALVGQVFLATLVARLVSAFRTGAAAERSRPGVPRRRPLRPARRGGGMSYPKVPKVSARVLASRDGSRGRANGRVVRPAARFTRRARRGSDRKRQP